MNRCPSAALAMRDAFAACKGWEQRARLLLTYSQQLPALSAEERIDERLIHGCESPVWCLARWPDNRLQLQLDTDARLLKGLLEVLRTRLEGLSPKELRQADIAAWFNELGLARQLSSSRSNGLAAVYRHILDNVPER